MSDLPPPKPAQQPPPESGHGLMDDWKPHLATMRNRLLTGLAVAFPLIVTLWLLWLSYSFILKVGRPVIDLGFGIVNFFLGREEGEAGYVTAPDWLLNLVAIVVPLLIFFFLGSMAHNVIGGRILGLVDKVFLRFPLISSIYSALKQMIDAFKGLGGSKNFQRVVYIDYPSPGCRLLGFVTGQYIDPDSGKGVTAVFLPTAPNPLTGFVLVIEDSRVVNSKLTVEQAMKFIISAGLVPPTPASGDAPGTPAGSAPPIAAAPPVAAPAIPAGKEPPTKPDELAEPRAPEANPAPTRHHTPVIDAGLTGYEDPRQ